MDYIPRSVIDRVLGKLSRLALEDRLHAIRALADVRGIRYLDDSGRPRLIDISLRPWLLTTQQLQTFHRLIHPLVGALARLPSLYAEHLPLRQIIRFSPEQQAWLSLASHRQSPPLAVIGRLDGSVCYDQANWRQSLRMLEPNAVGVGGVHYAPSTCSILLDVLEDVLTRQFRGHAVTPTPDPRELLIDELRAVARRLNRPLRAVALLENRDYTTGTDEFSALAEDLKKRGLQAVVADPRELRLTRGVLRVRDTTVDLLYRDSELSEFIELEALGPRLRALRQAIREGRLISSLQWEFDQKSAWEIFTDEQYARFFTSSERRFFREHLLWTRVVREEWASDPSGRRVDLPQFVRRHKDRLVLKPTTLFGGEGVMIGRTVSQGAWGRHLQRALRGNQRYVVQLRTSLPMERFPHLIDGKVSWQSALSVSGFFFNSSAIGLIGRWSSKPVVNVSQGGGLVGALWVH